MVTDQWKPLDYQKRKWNDVIKNNKDKKIIISSTTKVKGGYSGICVGRNEEKKRLRSIINKILSNHETTGIRVSGEGGVGKTHFLRFVQESCKSSTIYNELNISNDAYIDCVLIEAPHNPSEFYFNKLYSRMWDGLGKDEFLEDFAAILIHHAFSLIKGKKPKIDEQLSEWFGERWQYIPREKYSQILEKIQGFEGSRYKNFIDFLKNLFNILHQADRNFNKETFKTFLEYLEVINPDFDESDRAIKYWKLNLDEPEDNDKRDSLAIDRFKKFLSLLNWVYKRPVLIFAIDDFTNLKEKEIQDRFFLLAKLFRNSTENLCVIFVATLDEWQAFDESIGKSDRRSQLEGLFNSKECYFDMDYLMDEEISNWLGKLIQEWWRDRGIIDMPPDASWYPFSKPAFNYFINLDKHQKTPRSLAIKLPEVWERIAFSDKEDYFIPNEFEAWKVLKQQDFSSISPFEQKLLLDWKDTIHPGKFSGNLEERLLELFKFLRQEGIREIISVERNKEFISPNFTSKDKVRKGDVIINSQSIEGGFQAIIEIQVKTNNRPITKDELLSSKELLEWNCVNFLELLCFSDLQNDAKKMLEPFSPRVKFTGTSLMDTQKAYCILLANFNDIANRSFSIKEANQFFEIIFGESARKWIKGYLNLKKELGPSLLVISSTKIPAEPIKISSQAIKPLPEVAKPLPEVAKPLPEVAKPLPEVAKPLPEVTKPLPEVTKPPPEITKATKPIPEAAKPLPEITKATKPIPEAAKPLPKAIKPTFEPTSASPAKRTPPLSSELPKLEIEPWIRKHKDVLMWMLEKAITRPAHYQWTITLDWLQNREDAPLRDEVKKAFNLLADSKYGKKPKTSIEINEQGKALLKLLKEL